MNIFYFNILKFPIAVAARNLGCDAREAGLTEQNEVHASERRVPAYFGLLVHKHRLRTSKHVILVIFYIIKLFPSTYFI